MNAIRSNLTAIAQIAVMPVAGIIALLSGLALLPMLFLALLAAIFGYWPTAGALFVGGLVAIGNMVLSLDAINEGSWRKLAAVLALFAATLALLALATWLRPLS